MQEDNSRNDETISATDAIDAIEKALCLNERTVLVHSFHNSPQDSFVQDFSRITGISFIFVSHAAGIAWLGAELNATLCLDTIAKK